LIYNENSTGIDLLDGMAFNRHNKKNTGKLQIVTPFGVSAIREAVFARL
jgi:hypothetical protein